MEGSNPALTAERVLLNGAVLFIFSVYFLVAPFIPVERALLFDSPLDRAIPLWPAWELLYGAVYAVAFAPVLAIRDLRILRRAVLGYAFVYLVANAFFIIIPVFTEVIFTKKRDILIKLSRHIPTVSIGCIIRPFCVSIPRSDRIVETVGHTDIRRFDREGELPGGLPVGVDDLHRPVRLRRGEVRVDRDARGAERTLRPAGIRDSAGPQGHVAPRHEVGPVDRERLRHVGTGRRGRVHPADRRRGRRPGRPMSVEQRRPRWRKN